MPKQLHFLAGIVFDRVGSYGNTWVSTFGSLLAFRGVRLFARRLFGLKQITLDDGVNQRSQAVSFLANIGRYHFDVGPILESEGASQRISSQFVNHGMDELVLSIFKQEAFEAVNAVERFTVE